MLHFEELARDSWSGLTTGCSISKDTARTLVSSGTASTGLMGLAWRDADNSSSGPSLDSSSKVASTSIGFSGSASVVRCDLTHAATAQKTIATTTRSDVVARLRPPREAVWWASVALCAAATARQSAALRNVVIPATGAAVHGPTCSK
jgi:hypothetical protein